MASGRDFWNSLRRGRCTELWNTDTRKRLRNMFGHLSVTGGNHCILSRDSLLGSIHQHDVQATQHHVETLCQNKQSNCSLKLSLANLLLAIWSRGGILNVWPGSETLSCLVLLVLRCESVVSEGQAEKLGFYEGLWDSVLYEARAVAWCPWQSKVLATGGGMKDGILCVCELMMGQGLPRNQLKIWGYPMLGNSLELYGK
ncbi:LOW QUALITY PROTEIN: cell division cycle protein 20 homolog B [Sylvia borin]